MDQSVGAYAYGGTAFSSNCRTGQRARPHSANRPTIDHRSREFAALDRRVLEGVDMPEFESARGRGTPPRRALTI
jgi:hypothetical protein